MMILTMMGLDPGPLVRAQFFHGKYVGSLSGVGSGVFVLNGVESIGDIVPLFVFVSRGVECKGGQLIELFWRQKS